MTKVATGTNEHPRSVPESYCVTLAATAHTTTECSRKQIKVCRYADLLVTTILEAVDDFGRVPDS